MQEMDAAIMASSSRLLINESPLQVLPSLACAVGLNEAIVLQQVNYWLQSSKHDHDGRRWMYNSYPQWQKQFPFWSVPTLQRIFASLEKRGLLIVGNYNTGGFDRTKWYSIDYEVLNGLDPSYQVDTTSYQSDTTTVSKRHDHHVNLIAPIPETNAETTTTERVKAGPVQEMPPLPRPARTVKDRPDAPPVRSVPKTPAPPEVIARWTPDASLQAWWADELQEAALPATAIDARHQLKLWRLHPKTATHQAGQLNGWWQVWMLHAIEQYQERARDRKAARPPTPPMRIVYAEGA